MSNVQKSLVSKSIFGFASSIVALVLSLNTCVYNIVGYVAKPELTFIPPEQTLYAASKDNEPYLAMVTDFNIFNSSRPDKYGVVTGERLEFTIDGVQRVLRWQEFGKWGNKDFEAREPVHPFSVAGGATFFLSVSVTAMHKRRPQNPNPWKPCLSPKSTNVLRNGTLDGRKRACILADGA